MRPEQLAKAYQKLLSQRYGHLGCALHFSNPLELLVATILSAQCTDERVNKVTNDLFKKYYRPEDYAKVPVSELERDIRSTGFYKSKAKSIQAACREIAERYSGRVPDSMEALIKLRGVGRKTANVVLGTAFGKNEGVVVDTHVSRLSVRMGLTKHSDPLKIEQDLMRLFPRPHWTDISHWLIHHGRQICKARKPLCPICPLNQICPKIGVITAKTAGKKPKRNR